MGKIKSLLLLLMGAFLAIFIYENWVAAPYIKLFGREIIQLHISLIIIVVFALGFIFGWLGHFSWGRSRRKTAAPASREEKVPQTQTPAQQEEKQE